MPGRFIRLFILFTVTALQAQHIWERTNPGGGGAFNTIGASANGTVFAASDLSGAYKSTDNGQTWTVIGASSGLTETHVSGLGFHPSDGNIVYLGTENGIFRSQNGGIQFTKVLDSGYITDIECAPSNPQTVYASYHSQYNSADGQIYKSTDNGLTWQRQSSDLPAGIHILKIEIHPLHTDTLYILTGSGRWACGPARVFRSTDGGTHWSDITASLGQEILDMAVSSHPPHHLYLTTMNADCNAPYYWTDTGGNLYRSTDEGNTWQYLSDYTGVILFDTNDPETIRLIDPREPYTWNNRAGTFTSTDGGFHFTQTGNVTGWDTFFNGDPYWAYGTGFNGISLTIGKDYSGNNRIYWATTQWLFKSEDNGTTFQNIFTDEISPGFWRSRGVDNVNMMDLSISQANPDIIFLAYFDLGIWRSLDGGNSWQNVNPVAFTGNWQGYGGNCASVITDPQRSNVVWATVSENQNGEQPTYLVKNMHTGAKNRWTDASNGLPLHQIMGLSLDPASPVQNRTLFVTAGRDVYKSTDDGLTWQRVFNCNGCRFTAVDYFNGNIVYAAGENGVWKSVDGGLSWTDISHPDMITANGSAFWDWNYQGVFDLQTDPNQSGTVYVSVYGPGKGLYKSTDYGQTWQKILPDDYLRKVAVHPLRSDILYATSSSAFQAGGFDPYSSGIWFSPDGGQTWMQQNQGMAYPFALAVEVSASHQATVFVGSPGTGFQKSAVPQSFSISNPEYSVLRIYPNPAHDFIMIEPAGCKGKLSIYSLTGRRLLDISYVEKTSKGAFKADISSLKPGIYLIRCGDATGRFSVE